MIVKTRSVSHELGVMRSLNTRMNLPEEERKYYLNLEKGYQGEVMFDNLTGELQNNLLVVNDLCLQFNKTTFQIDTTIISQGTIFPFEVKNFEGDYYYDPKSNSFHTIYKKEIQNPLEQLKRGKNLLQDLLKSMGIYMPLDGYVGFVNPEFTLYHAPLDAPIIHPTQLNRFMKKLDQLPSRLNTQHYKIAEKLISLHNPCFYPTKLPLYEYGQQKKGILCPKCFSFMIVKGKNTVVCKNCQFKENQVSAILRSVEEIKLLFPDKKITTNLVYEWCGIIGSQKKIRRILKENYKKVGSDKWTYFE